MKKIILGLVLSISISTLFACHIDPLGKCENQSYFITRIFNPNSIYHFIVAGDTVETFTTGSVVQDSVFSLPIPAGTTVTMSYNYIGSTFIEYSSAVSSSDRYAGCGALAVHFADIKVQKDGNKTTIGFTNYDENEVLRYEIMVSKKDGKDWVHWQSVQPTGQHSYSIGLTTERAAKVIAAFVLPFMFFSRRKLNPLVCMLILMAVVLFSCTKETDSVKPIKLGDYSLVKVNAVKIDGGVISSEIKSL